MADDHEFRLTRSASRSTSGWDYTARCSCGQWEAYGSTHGGESEVQLQRRHARHAAAADATAQNPLGWLDVPPENTGRCLCRCGEPVTAPARYVTGHERRRERAVIAALGGVAQAERVAALLAFCHTVAAVEDDPS